MLHESWNGQRIRDSGICKGYYAQNIWKYFVGPLGITYRNVNMRTLIINCWNQRTKNFVIAYVLKIIPPFVLWELWRSRCSSKYGMERPSAARSISFIAFNITDKLKAKFGNTRLGEG